MEATLPELRLYQSTVLGINRAIDSRMLMNGLLWVSTDQANAAGGDWAPPPADTPAPGDLTPPTPQGGGIKQLIEAFAAYGARAYRDHNGNDVAAALPFPFPHHTKPELLELGRPLDPEVLAGLTEVVFAAARGLHIPTQYLVAGEGASNHWNDAELRRALHERAVYPELEVNNQFWTDYALRTVLRTTRQGELALGDDAPEEWRLGCDTSVLDVRSDSADTVFKSYDRGLISPKGARDRLAIAEDEALTLPADVSPYEHWMTGKAPGPRATTEAARDAGTQGVEPATPEPVGPQVDPVAAGALQLLERRA